MERQDNNALDGLTASVPPSYLIDIFNKMEACQDFAEHVGGWLWRTDSEHRFVHLSASVERLAGRKAEWHYGKTRQELGNICLADPASHHWCAQLARYEIFGPIDFVRVQDDKTFRMRTAGRPIFSKQGTFQGYAGIAVAAKMPEPSQDCRRKWPRTRVMEVAEIATSDGDTLFCVIEDISRGGARLRYCPTGVVPDRFHLKSQNGGARRPCEVRWRRGNCIGVRFVQ